MPNFESFGSVVRSFKPTKLNGFLISNETAEKSSSVWDIDLRGAKQCVPFKCLVWAYTSNKDFQQKRSWSCNKLFCLGLVQTLNFSWTELACPKLIDCWFIRRTKFSSAYKLGSLTFKRVNILNHDALSIFIFPHWFHWFHSVHEK